MSAEGNPALKDLAKDKKVGDVLFQIRLDRYENSLRHVGTHLLMTELSQKAVWEALQAGRAFVAFDWLADAAGFDLAALLSGRRHEMGEVFNYEKGLTLHGQSPLPGKWKLLRDGKIISESSGRSLDIPIVEPGNYRVEVWLEVAGEEMIWILSNPLYVRKSPEAR